MSVLIQVNVGENTVEKQKHLQQEVTQMKTQLEKKTHEISELQKSLVSNKKVKDEELKNAKNTISDLESSNKELGKWSESEKKSFAVWWLFKWSTPLHFFTCYLP